ncbi:unnamed protein product, partial [Discosporangium mesarthrocarpum]
MVLSAVLARARPSHASCTSLFYLRTLSKGRGFDLDSRVSSRTWEYACGPVTVRRSFWWGGDGDDGKKKDEKPSPKVGKDAKHEEDEDSQDPAGAGDRDTDGGVVSTVVNDATSNREVGDELRESNAGGATAQGAVNDPPPQPSHGSSPMLLGAMDQAPRHPRLIGLPITRRPLFPTTAHPYTITHPDVLEAVVKAHKDSRSYVGVFLRNDPKGLWGGGREAEAEGEEGHPDKPRFPEVITSLDEIHHVGTLAQVCVTV